MILIAPDKYKYTLTAPEAALIIAENLGTVDEIFFAPMADGGEGTADILASGNSRWRRVGQAWHNPELHIAIVDSSAYIGPGCFGDSPSDILSRSSRALGEVVRSLVDDHGVHKVFVGIGGTFTCDGGEGFLQALGASTTSGCVDLSPLHRFKDRIMGLSDVQVPLLPASATDLLSTPSALTFAPQKGATYEQLVQLYNRLYNLRTRLGTSPTPYDGAGGGLGYAIASVIGCKMRLGVDAVLDFYDIPWSEIRLIVTGEGSVDSQTSLGKVVGRLTSKGRELGIPVVTFGGRVDKQMQSELTIATDAWFPHLKLTPQTAKLRLREAVISSHHTIIKALKR